MRNFRQRNPPGSPFSGWTIQAMETTDTNLTMETNVTVETMETAEIMAAAQVRAGAQSPLSQRIQALHASQSNLDELLASLERHRHEILHRCPSFEDLRASTTEYHYDATIGQHIARNKNQVSVRTFAYGALI